MILKVILIILIILVVFLVLLPFALNSLGIRLLQFGAISGGDTVTKGVLIRSTDGGATWAGVGVSEEPRVNFPSSILDFAFHPRNSDVIYLGSQGAGLWVSVNGGASWRRLADERKILRPDADVYKVALSSVDPNVIYLAILQNNHGAVLKSEDGGKSFTEKYAVNANRTPVFDVWADPRDRDHAFIATGQGGFLETKNGGISWRARKWFSDGIRHLYINAKSPREFYLMTARGSFFKSIDGGENWSEIVIGVSGGETDIAKNPLGPSPFATFFKTKAGIILSDPVAPSTFYAGTKEGLLKTKNGGLTWTQLNLLLPPAVLPVDAIAVSPENQNIIFAAAANQLHKSEDGGSQWSIRTLVTQDRIRFLLIHPLRPEIMFAILGK